MRYIGHVITCEVTCEVQLALVKFMYSSTFKHIMHYLNIKCNVTRPKGCDLLWSRVKRYGQPLVGQWCFKQTVYISRQKCSWFAGTHRVLHQHLKSHKGHQHQWIWPVTKTCYENTSLELCFYSSPQQTNQTSWPFMFSSSHRWREQTEAVFTLGTAVSYRARARLFSSPLSPAGQLDVVRCLGTLVYVVHSPIQ